jgi:chemotaxis protein CheZ
MAEPRKVFRIEQTAAARLEPSAESTQAGLRHAEIMRELAALRGALAAGAPRRSRTNGGAARHGETARLTAELNLIAGAIRGSADGSERGGEPRNSTRSQETPLTAPMSRIDHELCAVVNGTEQATQKILAAAEAIDTAANNLSAALEGKIEQDLAQDIRDVVIQIFEACNFQDLIGQRVAKVMATLKFVEDHIARVLDEIKHASSPARRDGAQSLHGPRLDGDGGHITQHDVDALFAGKRR